MKNFIRSIKNIGLLMLIFVFITSCNNEDSEFTDSQMADLSFTDVLLQTPNDPITDIDLLNQYEEVMIEALKMSKEQNFREFIFNRALEQVDGDYDIFIDDITINHKSNAAFSKSVTKLESLSSNIISKVNGLRPLVFYPKAETLEEKIVQKNFNAKSDLLEPVVVFRGPYNDDYSVPSFTLNTSNELVFNRMVTEEDAWQNDVYVVGTEEDVSYIVDNCNGQRKNSPPDELLEYGCGGGSGGGTIGGGSSSTRTEGRAEYGGYIQLTDMNEIEHWVSGKFEFRLIVAGVQGSVSTVTKDISYPKRARKNFKDKKWYNYGTFIANWNTSNLGQFNIEKWMELDGGKSIATTIKIPSANGGPETSVTVPSEDKDDDLGVSIVQFTDALTTTYSISHMNFKRK